MKTVETTFTNRQHSRQINNNKLKKTWHLWREKDFPHMNIWTPLNDFKNYKLPSKDAFYISLTEEDISKTDYTHLLRVFNHFNITELRDYHNFSLLNGVLLLAEVLKNFRDVCLNIMVLIPPIITFPLVCPG